MFIDRLYIHIFVNMSKIIIQKKGKFLKCKRCNHFWKYLGNSNFVTSCPRCRTSVTISNKNKKNTRDYNVNEDSKNLHLEKLISPWFFYRCLEEHYDLCPKEWLCKSNNHRIICKCKCHYNNNNNPNSQINIDAATSISDDIRN